MNLSAHINARRLPGFLQERRRPLGRAATATTGSVLLLLLLGLLDVDRVQIVVARGGVVIAGLVQVIVLVLQIFKRLSTVSLGKNPFPKLRQSPLVVGTNHATLENLFFHVLFNI